MEDHQRHAHERAEKFHRNPQVQIDFSRLSEAAASRFTPTMQVEMPPQQAEYHRQQAELYAAALTTVKMAEAVPIPTSQPLERKAA